MEQIHKYTVAQKLEWWGEGPWVDEPDEVTFQHRGIDCRIFRLCMGKVSGPNTQIDGFLDAAIRIPEEYIEKRIEINASRHPTYMREDATGVWIAIQCGHIPYDLAPSMMNFAKTHPEGRAIELEYAKKRKRLGIKEDLSSIATYADIDFCIGECHSMVDQLLEAK